VKSCAPCAKAKAACKPFDADLARAKARAEAVWRSQARKTKQQTDAEWKTKVSRKLEELNELRGLSDKYGVEQERSRPEWSGITPE